MSDTEEEELFKEKFPVFKKWVHFDFSKQNFPKVPFSLEASKRVHIKVCCSVRKICRRISDRAVYINMDQNYLKDIPRCSYCYKEQLSKELESILLCEENNFYEVEKFFFVNFFPFKIINYFHLEIAWAHNRFVILKYLLSKCLKNVKEKFFIETELSETALSETELSETELSELDLKSNPPSTVQYEFCPGMTRKNAFDKKRYNYPLWWKINYEKLHLVDKRKELIKIK